MTLLSGKPIITKSNIKITPPGIDINAPATRKTPIHGQLVWPTLARDIHKHAFNTGLMKFIVLSETTDITEQAGVIDFWALVMNLH